MIPRTTLSAVWYGTGDLRLEDRPLAALGPTDVLVEVVNCGVCATDLHLLDGSIRLYPPPRLLGHEIGGSVRATGDSVEHVQTGDAVAVDTGVACNTCFHCREGRPFMCTNRRSVGGGFSEYMVVPASLVYRLPAGVSARLGALAEPLSCALHAVERAEIRPADSVAVVGAGGLGLMVLNLARLSGATRTLVSDPDPRRRELALHSGASRVVDPAHEDLLDVAREMTDGRGVDCAFEAVGLQATLEQAFELPRAGGTLVQVSVPSPEVRVPLKAYDLFARELTIRGSYIRTTEFRRAVELLATLDLSAMMGDRYGLRDIHAAIDAARRHESVRVLVGSG
ncbi:MAG: alcohol dehydrogenase catalytic domain-containing protein [Chloroflexi bacterium]|nr:alcohol dehydrogenase catalytic domain-containing protein [Chloroflexota bacterium]